MQLHRSLTQLLFVCLLMFSLLALPSDQVSAATPCTWQGGNGDWATPGNWDCGRVPNTGDDIVISQNGVGPQINPATAGIDANSITIASVSLMTVNASDSSLIIYANTFINEGEVIINGNNTAGNGLQVNSPGFSNNGKVTINAGGLSLVRGGTHSGDFIGSPGTYLSISTDWENQIFNFTDQSQIQVPIIQISGSGGYAPTVNVAGILTPWLVSETDSRINISGSGTSVTVVNITSDDVMLPYEVSVGSSATLNLPNTSLDISKLRVILGTLNNPAPLRVMNYLELSSFNLTGAGNISIDNLASTFTLRGGTILGKTLINGITANWLSGNITLSNGAGFTNNGTFNAKATTTMTGTATESFINNSSFVKSNTGTVTTMNLPFYNYGTVDVTAGELVFKLVGGTFNPGETLNLGSGESLAGTGTLAANLVNSGKVAPGASPGIITVDGDYTQESSGVLEIELGGTTAGTEFDQLVVTGAATLGGTLNVSVFDDFTPQKGQSFFILEHQTSGTGNFATVNLPELTGGLKLEIEYGASGVTLTVVESSDTFIFLPMILR